jgi:hypothetical protein
LGKIHHAETIARADRHVAACFLGKLSHMRFRNSANAEVSKCSIADRHRRRRQLVFVEARDLREVAQFRECISQPRHGRLGQLGAGSDLLVAEKAIPGMESAEHIEASGERDDEFAIRCRLLLGALHPVTRLEVVYLEVVDNRRSSTYPTMSRCEIEFRNAKQSGRET